jgi:hypothetical protein
MDLLEIAADGDRFGNRRTVVELQGGNLAEGVPRAVLG